MHNRIGKFSIIDLPLAVFLLSAVLAVIPAYDRSLAWGPLAVLLACGAGYLAISRLADQRRKAVIIARASVLVGGAIGLYFVTQYAHYPGLDKVETISRLTELIGRITPAWVIWTPVANSIATLLEGLFFLAGGLALVEIRRGWKIAAAAMAALMALALLVSESRGAWLAVLLAALIWLALYYRPARWLAFAIAGGLVLLVALVVIQGDILVLGRIPLVDRTLAPLFIRPDRLDVYRGSLYLIQDVPLTGIGLGGQFAMNYSRYVLLIQVPFLTYSHNLYLELWLEQGLLGLAAWVWLAAGTYYCAYRARKAGSDRLFESTWVGLTAILLHGVFDARQYSDWWCWAPVFLLLGLNAALFASRQPVIAVPRSWIPAAVMGLFVLAVTVTMPALPAVWHANVGSLTQARADLQPGLNPAQRKNLRDQAIHEFEDAVHLAVTSRTAQARLGLMLTEDGRFSEAVTHLEAAFNSDPTNTTTAKALGLAYLWNGQLEKAGKLLPPSKDMIQELNNWGWWRSTQNQANLARFAYQLSLKLNPDQPEVLKALDGLGP